MFLSLRFILTVAVSAVGTFPLEAAPVIIPRPKSVTLGTGSLTLRAESRVVALDPSLGPLAGVLASDIARLHGVKLATGKAGPAGAGDIALRLVPSDRGLQGADAYRIRVDTNVTVEGRSYQAVAMGMMTVLQALRNEGGALVIDRMKVEDFADRAFRGLQVSIRGAYHPPEWVKKAIDLARFHKVRIVQLHTSESHWIGAVMDSSNSADPALMKEQAAWSKREMEEVIDHAVARGVSLVPHNEMRPNDPLWVPALMKDFNPGDKFAGYVDEIDGKGAYEIKGNLADDPRWWNFLKTVSQRSRDQFARSWPGGKLPYYHIGPVYGEGGCTGKEAVKMLGFLKEGNPGIKMMYWNGPGNADPDMTPHKDDLVVDFYSATWGGTPDGLLAAGYTLCNTSWTPLYIQPGTRVKAMRQGKWIHDEFHLGRFGDEAPFGEPIASRVRDGSAHLDRIIGSLMATWDFNGPDDREGHLEMISPCIPYFAEHIWNVRPWPYPAGSWEKASADAAKLVPMVHRLLRDERPSSAPGSVTATDGVLSDAVEVLWAESDNYPESYQVYRGENDDLAAARPVSGLLPASFVTKINSFRDHEVEAGKSYHYWVRSINPSGASDLGRPVKGAPGPGVPLPAASESFGHPAGTALESLAGGSGFKGGWKIEEFNAPLVIAPQGLTYPGLKSSGRALRVESTDADETNRRRPPHVRITRPLSNGYGRNGTRVWTSYLIRGERVEIGEIAANIGRTNIGKGWGKGLSVYTSTGGGEMEPGKTYLIVVRYTFHEGNDLIHLWVNPTPGTVPADADADVITRAFDNPESDAFTISMQPYGKGCYDLDEIRVGRSYDEVVPIGD